MDLSGVFSRLGDVPWYISKPLNDEDFQVTLFEVEEYWDFNYVTTALRSIDANMELKRLSRLDPKDGSKSYLDEEVPL